MATEDYKYQLVRDDEKDYPSEGEWEYLVHDCHTPSKSEINTQAAAAGTVWKCGNCSNRWRLISRKLQSRHPLMGSDQEELQWIRITPIKDEAK
jgi:hypothetical protein